MKTVLVFVVQNRRYIALGLRRIADLIDEMPESGKPHRHRRKSK